MSTGQAGQTARDETERYVLLAQRFVALADTLVDDYDVVDLLDQLVQSCVELLDVSQVGLMLVDQEGNLSLVASSSEQTRLLELLQIQTEEGPCPQCVRERRAVTVPDIAASADEWPQFARAAGEAGFTSVQALPLRLRNDTIGGLNLFNSVDRPPLSAAEQRIAQSLADVATIGILQQRASQRASLLAEQLQSALTSRIVVEQAKGVIAERGGVDMDAAFAHLRSWSRAHRRKLAEVADDVVQRRLDPAELLAARHRH
ncbi:ANTAR domain-containing protein [Pedococcus sp. NPDC057267]|uniref:GAF and ANTAR domain-containing protein n=1 Tax=Pedococcus sp. NPDC057267 TaxID=3346077 RepID=UPI00363ACC63